MTTSAGRTSSSRRDEVLAAAVDLLGREGLHGLTHGRVDRAAGLPAGTASNHFRTRAALVTAVADALAARRLADGAGAHDEGLALGWFELLIAARREPWIAEAIAPMRARMAELVERQRDDRLPITTPELMALLTGLEFGALATGIELSRVLAMLGIRGTSAASPS